MNQKSLAELSEIISDEHLRHRIKPRPGDRLYLHLSDLLSALQARITNNRIDLLDYGAGGSPYRLLFPNADYKRADFAIGDGKGLDYILGDSMHVAASDNSFDLILSTQVLEHVVEPEKYLSECLRLLRPGGRLLLTTHGVYADHPCPYDLYRWTADGLASLCKQSGFEVSNVDKLTVGPRALLFLYDTHGRDLHRRTFSFFSALFALFYRFHNYFRPSIHRWADKFFPNSRVVKNEQGTNDIYINLLVEAVKPIPE